MADFWIDNIEYPNDYRGEPAYGAPTPGHPSWQRMTRWDDLGPHGPLLRGESPQWIWMHPATNWKIWDLSGPREGRQGVTLATDLDGVMDLDFEHRYSGGPYMVGTERERTDYKMRTVTLGVWINPSAPSFRSNFGVQPGPFAMHMVEDSWRQSWSRTVPGMLGCFTRTHGWRFLALIQGERTKTDLRKSPTAYGNNAVLINITAHAPWPLLAKPAITRTWQATQDDVDAHGLATHVFTIPNRGTWQEGTYPKYLVQGAGDVTIQDGIEGKQVPLPTLHPKQDGSYMLVDTDPARQTIITEKQPIDTQLYKGLRNSQFLELLFHEQLEETLPAQRRIPGGIEFDNPIPPRTVAHLKVTHTNPQGSVSAIMPQYFESSWS